MPEQNKINDPIAKDFIQTKMNAIVNEFVSQTESQEAVKELIRQLKERYDLKPTVIRKLARAMANDKMNEVLETNADVIALMSVLK